MPGCTQRLVQPTEDGADSTPVGVECHIVAQRDSTTVARSVSLLTEDEKKRHHSLIDNRHHERNLVLMCATHSKIVDDPRQREFTVDRMVEIKAEHERRDSGDGPTLTDGQVDLSALAALLGAGEDAAAWDHKAMIELRASFLEEALWLVKILGTPERVSEIESLVATWPRQLADGPIELPIALARKAEKHGRHDLASEIWERLARSTTGPVRADRLTRAAINAEVSGDSARMEKLLAEAEAEDPDCVRARIQRLDDSLPPQDLIDALKELHTEDEALQALIALHIGRACLMLPDLEKAARQLDRAEALGIDDINLTAMRVNLSVQDARLALLEDRETALDDTRQARQGALDLRQRLQAMNRWVESGRLLMLAADIDCVMRQPEAAAALLAEATPEELDAPDGAEVLADAALRAMAPGLALDFIGQRATDGARRMRATAKITWPGAAGVEALVELERLVEEGGPEAEHAAGTRLTACVFGAPFHEPSADALAGTRHERVTVAMRVISLAEAGEFAGADRALGSRHGTWADELRAQVAMRSGDKAVMKTKARALLRGGPDATGKIIAGQALMSAGAFDDAVRVLVDLARSVNAPPAIRSDAYALLLRCLAETDAWTEAAVHWEAWCDLSQKFLRSPDGRVSAWYVRVANRTRKS